MNSDCTGTVTQTGGNFHFVVAADGSKVFWIETDPGTVISGSADGSGMRIMIKGARTGG